MMAKIRLGEIDVDVVKKDIKNIHLSVYPPVGKVRISAPLRMELGLIRVYAISKLGWIKKQQNKLREQERETPRKNVDRESHYLWGKRYLLRVVEREGIHEVVLKHSCMTLYVKPGSTEKKKQQALDEMYRAEVKKAVTPLVAKWEPLMGVKVDKFYVQRMKTRWGSCNHTSRTIRLNTELAKKPRECLEYVVVHEMAHLLEPTHNRRFVNLMDTFMPKWQEYRQALNRLPVRHELWSY